MVLGLFCLIAVAILPSSSAIRVNPETPSLPLRVHIRSPTSPPLVPLPSQWCASVPHPFSSHHLQLTAAFRTDHNPPPHPPPTIPRVLFPMTPSRALVAFLALAAPALSWVIVLVQTGVCWPVLEMSRHRCAGARTYSVSGCCNIITPRCTTRLAAIGSATTQQLQKVFPPTVVAHCLTAGHHWQAQTMFASSNSMSCPGIEYYVPLCWAPVTVFACPDMLLCSPDMLMLGVTWAVGHELSCACGC